MISDRPPIPGVILAGGLATRMGGGDKPLLRIGGETILGRVVRRLRDQADPVALNANGDPLRFRDTDLPVIADSIAGHPGPLAGVLAGLDWAASIGAESIVTVAGDTPFFPADLSDRLRSAADESEVSIALAATLDPERGMIRHPTFGLWPTDLRQDLRAALQAGVRKVVQWTDGHGAVTAQFPVDPYDPFFNINTPADLARAEQIAETA